MKGYGKSVTKEDLKKWFKPFGKINCIQYKGPYSFIVDLFLFNFRNSMITMMLNTQSNKCMIKKLMDFDLLFSHLAKKKVDLLLDLDPRVILANEEGISILI